MHAVASRVGRLPLALTLVLLGACADESLAPKLASPLRPNAAMGDIYTVTNPNDDGSIGTLRWALKFSTGGEIIRFDPSLAGQTIAVDSTIYISKSVTIEGPAGDGITINGGGKGRIFRAEFTGTVTFRNLSITGGSSGTSVGPVLLGSADVAIDNSTFSGNTGGAGTVIFAGNITLTNSTVSDNIAANVTAGQEYGAVQGDTVVLVNSTVANNGYAGVVSGSGLIVLRNSILANNFGSNCAHYYPTFTLVHEGSNISDDDKCGGPGEIIIADPKLGPLADNGGPTMTRALLAGSPAINAGTSCSLTVDQRYMARDAQCDLGAFEFADFTKVTITIDPTSIVKQTGWAVVTGTVTCSRAESFDLAIELHQNQKLGRDVVDVHAASTVPFACSTTARPFSASMVLTEGAFQNGAAQASVATLDAEAWVTPASVSGAVRLFRSR